MKIALPSDNGEVNQHFGRSTSFAVVEIDNNQVVRIDEISAQGLQHRHEGLADLLKAEQVEVVIVGGIGAGAIQGLESRGLKVLFGASGSIKEVAERVSRGEFVSERKVCSHHGEHKHHHEHGHGGWSHD